MSVSPRHTSLFPVVNVTIAAALLISVACHARPVVPQPTEVETSGQRQRSTDEVRPPHFPGVDIVPLGRSVFVIRIHSGMVGDGNPLYVIDGAPLVLSPNRGIDWLRPEDIAQIKVLKTPDELAVYGPNGVNGVILITTKLAAGRARG